MMTIEISCEEVLREISRYVDGEISGDLRQLIEAHFKTCDHCTAILDGTRNILRLVGDGRAFEVPAGFGSRLYSRLEAELHR